MALDKLLPMETGTPTVELLPTATVTVEQARYEDLLAKEERLRLLEQSILQHNGYLSDIERIKKLFDIKEQEQ